MTLVGADPAALDDLAGRCVAAADTLDAAQKQVGARLGSSPWSGPDAATYRSQWSSKHRATLSTVAKELRQAGELLRKNAREQRQASDSSGGAMPASLVRRPGDPVMAGVLAGVVARPMVLSAFYENLRKYEKDPTGINPEFVRQLPGLPWAVTQGREQLAAVARQDSAAQQRWWDSLSPQQQAALLFAYPGSVLALRGLPTTVQQTAARQFALEEQSTVGVRSVQETVSGELKLGVADLGARGSATTSQFANGEAKVTLDLKGDLAKSFGDSYSGGGGSVGVEGGLSATYRFDSVADAQEFVNGLKERLRPDVLRTVAGDGPIDYLRMNKYFHRSTEASLAVTAEMSVKVGPLDAKLSGAAGGAYDLETKEKTLFIEGRAAVKVGSAEADISEKVSLRLDANNNVTSATISGTITASGPTSAAALVDTISNTKLTGDSGSAGSVSFSATVNPNDPAVQAALVRLAEQPGDPAAIQSLLNQSHSHISVDRSSTTSTGINVVAGKLSDTVTTTNNVVTYAKPPSGPWVNMSL